MRELETGVRVELGSDGRAKPKANGSSDWSGLTEPPPRLPESFWHERPWIYAIRAYARSRMFDPAMLLGATLARLAAFLPAGSSMDTGVMDDQAALALCVAAIGPSGGGKSEAMKAARRIIQPPPGMDHVDAQIKTGEGIAEAFMGEMVVNPDDPVKNQVKERRQVRHNAFFFHDEGGVLIRLADKSGGTIMETLRTAGTGGRLGGFTAKAELRRTAEGYCIGICIIWQPATIGPLLDDVLAGTPQRFLYVMQEPPVAQTEGCALPVLDLPTGPVHVTFDPEIQVEIRETHLARLQARLSMEPDYQSHALLMHCKTAALLAILRRSNVVDESDWKIAAVLCQHSAKIVEWLNKERARMNERTEADRRDVRVRTAEACAASTRNIDTKIERIAKLIANRVRDAGEMTRRELHNGITSRDRHLLADAAEFCLARDWIVITARGYGAGRSRPA